MNNQAKNIIRGYTGLIAYLLFLVIFEAPINYELMNSLQAMGGFVMIGLFVWSIVWLVKN